MFKVYNTGLIVLKGNSKNIIRMGSIQVILAFLNILDVYSKLTHYMPLASFYTPGNIRKPVFFWTTFFLEWLWVFFLLPNSTTLFLQTIGAEFGWNFVARSMSMLIQIHRWKQKIKLFVFKINNKDTRMTSLTMI